MGELQPPFAARKVAVVVGPRGLRACGIADSFLRLYGCNVSILLLPIPPPSFPHPFPLPISLLLVRFLLQPRIAGEATWLMCLRLSTRLDSFLPLSPPPFFLISHIYGTQFQHAQLRAWFLTCFVAVVLDAFVTQVCAAVLCVCVRMVLKRVPQ